MTDRTTLGDFILSFHGLAMLRAWWTDPATVKARSQGIVGLTGHLAEEPWSRPFHVDERTVATGYAEWAETYDAPGNPMMLAEEPVVREILGQYPAGKALDAACGTGRLASILASLGHEVVGIDSTPEMLDAAKSKAIPARFEVGDLKAIPLPDDSMHLAVCALSLTHFADLGPPVRELARVVRTGGHVVISDVHPQPVTLGAHASYNRTQSSGGFIRNHIHLHSSYLTAFREAGLDVVQCVEPLYGDRELSTFGHLDAIPGLVKDALMGLPIVIIWELVKQE